MAAGTWSLTEQEVERRLADRRRDPALDELLGPAQHAELRDLVHRAARAEPGDRVLVLPGLMGSTLGIRREKRADDVKWFDPVEIAIGGLARIAQPSQRRIEPVGVILFAYLRLKLELRAAGFAADFHPYDWRQGMQAAAHGLARRLEQEPAARVHLVAHGTGGLVARALLAHKAAARLGRVVQLGTPNRGSYVALRMLRGTHPLVRRLALLDLTHDAKRLARRVFGTFASLAELLPPAEACEDFDPFRPGAWPRGPKPAAQLLRAAFLARQTLPQPDERFALIAGTGRETLTGLRWRDGRLEFRIGDDGDGSVPLALAQTPDLASWFVRASHGALPGDARVIRTTIEILRRGYSIALPQVPVASERRARWVVEEQPDTSREKLFWSDLGEDQQRSFLHEFLAPATTLAVDAPASRAASGASEAVELRLSLASITEEPAEAIALGVFSNVEPSGAAAAVDEVLGGTVRDLGRRRAIGATAGEVFVLPAAHRNLRARYVVFAGLGDFGRYGADVQRLAAANVTRTLALAGVKEIAFVLWGTASGVPPAHAAQSMLGGILAALDELEPGQRPRRLSFASRSRRRLTAARTAMELVLATSPRRDLVRLQPRMVGEVVRKPRPVERATAQSYLFVQQEGGELRAALLGATPKGTVLAATRKLDTRSLDRHLGTLGEGLAAGTVERFGAELARLLLPEATLEALPAVRDTPLVVVHDITSSHWPWETLNVDDWSPAAAAGLSRRYAAVGMSVAKWREERRVAPRLKVLMVVNPTGDLSGADDEGRRVHRELTRQDSEVTLLTGSEATRARLLDEFRSGAWDVLHYAGHAFFDASSPSSGGILCAGGRVLSGADLAALDALPALVFFNACESARLRQAGQVVRALSRSTGFAEAFLRGGVANFIGTWWPVSDAAAARFAGSLYGQLSKGAAIGDAMRTARAAVLNLGSADWANYLHYGSYDFQLKRPPRR